MTKLHDAEQSDMATRKGAAPKGAPMHVTKAPKVADEHKPMSEVNKRVSKDAGQKQVTNSKPKSTSK